MSIVSWAETVLLVSLGLLATQLWLRNRSGEYSWLAATFGVLGAVVVVGQALPNRPSGHAQDLIVRLLIAAIILFPYLLYRFALHFQPRRRKWLFRFNTGVTVGLCVWTLVLPSIPRAGSHRSVLFTVFIALVLAQWTGLSGLVSYRLWALARNEPTVARRRMRTLAMAAAGMALAILVSASSNSAKPGGVQLVAGIIVLLAVPLFLMGVAPPGWLQTQWRSQDMLLVREATIDLVAALNADEIAGGLLPRVVSFSGGKSAALFSTKGEVLGNHLFDDEQLSALAANAAGRASATEVRVEDSLLWVPMTTGWLVIATTSFTPFFGQDEARVLMSIGVVADMALSRALLLQRERANVEAMRDFVAIASHDLRTPTAAITGYASLLERKWEAMSEKDKVQGVTAIARQSVHLRRLVEDLLTTSRIDAAAVASQPVLFDVADHVGMVIREMNLTNEVAIDAEPGICILMDPEHFHRAIINFVRNAQVYGAPPVRIRVSVKEGDATVRVIDEGDGIPADFAPRLFEKFARADKKMSTASGGTGLGLSIVKGLVEAAGGTAFYEPHLPHGSVFGITVPRAIPTQAGKEQQTWTSDESSSLSKTN